MENVFDIINDSEHASIEECAYLENAVEEACIAARATLKSDTVEGLNGSDIDSAISFGAAVSPEDMENEYVQGDDDNIDDEYEFDDDAVESIADAGDDTDVESELDAWEEYEEAANEF